MPGFVEEESMGENTEAPLRTSDIKQRLNRLLANRHSTGSSMAGVFGPIPYMVASDWSLQSSARYPIGHKHSQWSRATGRYSQVHAILLAISILMVAGDWSLQSSARYPIGHKHSQWSRATGRYSQVHAIPLAISILKSPHRYVESEVTIHYRSPVRSEAKEVFSEEELARRQAEAMRRIYQEERRRKYLQELQDMNSRRHTDNFTPSQKSPISLNRYDDFLDDISKSKARDRTPEPKLVARALYNFVGQTSRELSFRRGDIIFVRRQIDKNWYEGEHNAMIGLFPFNYIEAKAKFNFIAQTHLELSLIKGEMVVLTRRVDDNWFEGRIGAKKGIFPVSYVEVLQEPGERPSKYNITGENPSYKGDILTPSTPVNKPVTSPASHSVLVNGSSSSKPQNHTHTSSYYKTSPARVTSPPAHYQLSTRHCTSTPTLTLYREYYKYRALYNYRPQNDDELELVEGDTVYVMEKCDDGWYVGSSERSGYFGTFPGNYVERI
uniref:SH3 domain-containing protein n=1 Tax=Timema bartmani TaxID=61472 RepID=A0A7R9F3M5_9NEOP|nr:unnamed protein product [Timema bartmani]